MGGKKLLFGLFIVCFFLIFITSCGGGSFPYVSFTSHKNGESVDKRNITLEGDCNNCTKVFVGTGEKPDYWSVDIISNSWSTKINLVYGQNIIKVYGLSKISNKTIIGSTNEIIVDCTVMTKSEKRKLLIGHWVETSGSELVLNGNGKMTEITSLGENEFDWSLSDDGEKFYAGLDLDNPTTTYTIEELTEDDMKLEVKISGMDDTYNYTYKKKKE